MPLTQKHYQLIPDLMYGKREWDLANLPELVEPCRWCAGEGQYDQMYTAGCGGGYYSSQGTCSLCDGVGLKLKSGAEVPLSVINQIVVAQSKGEA